MASSLRHHIRTLTFKLAISTDASSSGSSATSSKDYETSCSRTKSSRPCESWQHSEDGLTWTFDLRKDVRWHDGTPFTAHDVDFTFNRIIYNHDIPASSRPSFHFRVLNEETGVWEESPMSVTALDDYTVQCVLPVPFAPFLRSMGTAIYPEHLLDSHVETEHSTRLGTSPRIPQRSWHGPVHNRTLCAGERVVLKRKPRLLAQRR